MKILLFLLACGLGLTACKKDTASTVTPATSTLTSQSTAFIDTGTLPITYTCDGASTSPPISWANAPAGTTSFAVTMHHIPPTGDRHVYMLLYNIPASATSLLAGTSGVGLFGPNTVNGKTQYSPPCSQGPGAKLYVLTVYALSAAPDFTVPQSAVTMDLLLAAINKTTLGTSAMTVSYTRP